MNLRIAFYFLIESLFWPFFKTIISGQAHTLLGDLFKIIYEKIYVYPRFDLLFNKPCSTER